MEDVLWPTSILTSCKRAVACCLQDILAFSALFTMLSVYPLSKFWCAGFANILWRPFAMSLTFILHKQGCFWSAWPIKRKCHSLCQPCWISRELELNFTTGSCATHWIEVFNSYKNRILWISEQKATCLSQTACRREACMSLGTYMQCFLDAHHCVQDKQQNQYPSDTKCQPNRPLDL